MAYTFDSRDRALIINGFQNGIADDPFSGIADMRNMNIVSVPGEASVNFATTLNTDANVSGTITSASAVNDTILISGANIAQLQAITIAGTSLPAGIVAGTVYWAVPTSGGNYNLYTNYVTTTLLDITTTGTPGNWTYTSVNMGQPKYFTHLVTPYTDTYFMVDSTGYVWNNGLVSSANWRYTGNTITGTNGSTHGNGLVAYVPSDSGTTAIGYIFVFRDYQIDYATITSNSALVWTYGWNPATGTTAQNGYLKAYTPAGASLTNPIHESMVLPDNKVYYCDSNYIGRWYQADPNVGFVPTTPSTYVFDQTQVLPFTDVAQCLAPLGNNLLIGGKQNIIYPWDTFSQLPSFPIFVAEYNIVKLLTVNTNTYILAGNRGRIYYTNGSQAQLYKKIPDHISGTVEPYFTWGGIMSNKNQLYFGVSATTNAGVAISEYGGLWGIDLDSKAIRLTNKLSYGTYAGYPTALIPNFATNPGGTGFYAGWDSGASTYGVDTTTSNPYNGSQATVDSDLIPIGTYNMPRDFERVEYRLTKAMVSGESVTIQYRLLFDKTDQTTPAINTYTTILTDSTVGNYSNSGAVNFKNAQWVQFRAILNSTVTTPSYTRLKEFRITGLQGQGPMQAITL